MVMQIVHICIGYCLVQSTICAYISAAVAVCPEATAEGCKPEPRPIYRHM